MSIRYPPQPGTLVICDYSTGFREPEMVKRRLAVVLSPRLPHRGFLCTVVPLSTTPSRTGIRYQCRVTLPISPPPPFEGTIKWAKADMLATLAYGGSGRLTLPHTGKDPATGKRQYVKIVLPEAELRAVQRAVLYALGMDSLTDHL